jgi:hypothetical protein
MELVWLVYGIGVLGNIIVFLSIITAGCGAVTAFNLLNEEVNKAKPWLIACMSLSFVLAILPSEKTAYTMVGAYAAQRLAQNSEVQELSGKVLTIIEQQMDKYIVEGAKPIK